MKTLSVAQQASLTQPDTLTRCIKISALNQIFAFTELDKELTFDIGDGDGEVTYLRGLKITSTDATRELSIEDSDISGLLGSVSIPDTDIRGFMFFHAPYKTLFYDYEAELFVGILKAGHIGSAEIQDDDLWLFEGPGLSQNLTKPLLSVTQAECRYDVFDEFCGITNAGFTNVGTVTSVLDVRSNFIAILDSARADNFHQFGLVTFTSGANLSSRPMDVKAHKNVGSPGEDQITLQVDMGFDISVGDTFSIEAGCDKKRTGDCSATKFSNEINFGGEDFIPGRDAIREIGT